MRIYNKYISTDIHGEKLGCFAEDEYGKIAVNVGLCRLERKDTCMKASHTVTLYIDMYTK